MRCNNCGWENSTESNRCIKCNAPLKGSMIKPVGKVEPSEPAPSLSQTVKGAIPSEPFLDDNTNTPPSAPKDRPGNQQKSCKNCGYPLNPQATTCPRCNEQVSSDSKSSLSSKNPLSGTVKPDYMAERVADPKFSLQAIGKENEAEFPDTTHIGQKVVLNRANLEPDNLTITSGEQAEIFQEDGKWYIIDHSAMKTTFKYVSEPMVLNSGDVILLGNRKFKFELE